MEKRQQYRAPDMQTVTFRVEQGFTASNEYGAPMEAEFLMYEDNNEEQNDRASSFGSQAWSW